MIKDSVENLALFDGPPLFNTTKSTSNLVQPDFNRFLEYSRIFHDQRRYTNNGPLVKQLEQRLAQFHGSEHCVSFCSGFWALAITLKSLALAGRREVAMPSLTYRRMDDIARWAGLTPVFYDVTEDGLSAGEAQIERMVSAQTGVILGVHPIVNCCDVSAVLKVARRCGVPVIFDSVESVYEWLPEGKVGQFGDAEIFSLHASKLINGFEGGYVTTNDPALAEALALRRGFGFKGPDRVVVDHAMNAKLNEIHAAMALAGLDDLEAQVIRNRERYLHYRSLLRAIDGVTLVEFDQEQKTSYKNILVSLGTDWPLSRSLTLDLLNAENILARPYYSPPLHHKGEVPGRADHRLSNTDLLAERYMLLPCGHFVDRDDIRSIVDFLIYVSTHAGQILQRDLMRGGTHEH